MNHLVDVGKYLSLIFIFNWIIVSSIFAYNYVSGDYIHYSDLALRCERSGKVKLNGLTISCSVNANDQGLQTKK